MVSRDQILEEIHAGDRATAGKAGLVPQFGMSKRPVSSSE